ncbi:hypothetical protein [Rhodopirellula islandica]|nr:hypothetical protein [Rhodopirellula islandica]
MPEPVCMCCEQATWMIRGRLVDWSEWLGWPMGTVRVDEVACLGR